MKIKEKNTFLSGKKKKKKKKPKLKRQRKMEKSARKQEK